METEGVGWCGLQWKVSPGILESQCDSWESHSMLIHSVYFWLKPELSAAQNEKFRSGLDSLAAISVVDKIYIGGPAATPRRPLIDSSYSYALILFFKDLAAHDAYQIDPIHVAFNASCKELWARVQIYDAT
jgi:hypothetical protein